MGFLRRAIDFAVRPTQSRTMGLVVVLLLVVAVSLTVYVAQQQQSLRQRAAPDYCNDKSIPTCGSPGLKVGLNETCNSPGTKCKTFNTSIQEIVILECK